MSYRRFLACGLICCIPTILWGCVGGRPYSLAIAPRPPIDAGGNSAERSWAQALAAKQNASVAPSSTEGPLTVTARDGCQPRREIPGQRNSEQGVASSTGDGTLTFPGENASGQSWFDAEGVSPVSFDEKGGDRQVLPIPVPDEQIQSELVEIPSEVPTPQFISRHLDLEDVVTSIYQSYPLLESAVQGRTIAAGEQLSASGGFDTKFKAMSENGPVGFYQTYRQTVGVIQPLYTGGEAFAGYRIGRGDFEPWYRERETNGGGEFKAGVVIPLAQGREIDGRRADLWRAGWGRQLVEPDIQAQLIGFVQEGSYAYWDWVAAGARYRIAERILFLAEDRTDRIRSQVEAKFLDPPELTDNLRLVAERAAKLADAFRKLQQTAVKLSLYHRDQWGRPLIPGPAVIPEFPEPTPVDPQGLGGDIQMALGQRPEIAVINLIQRQLDVDYAEARNDYLPALDAVIAGSKDMGEPTSKKNDKGPFVLDASLFLDVPLQRRKAQGKMLAIEGKVAQLRAKRRLTEDKIVAEVQVTYAALIAAYEQVEQTRQAVEYAEDLARRERLNFENGLSDLLKVTLREQYAVESAEKAVDALLMYYLALADYRAALAQDRLP